MVSSNYRKYYYGEKSAKPVSLGEVMSIANIISLFGGVAMFLFGMSLMGDGLKKVAGSKLELVLYRLSGTPLKGVLLGAGVTAVIQSSSATSVMAVGFVNSGMMKAEQAIAVILGAIVGTSITGWVICLSSIEGSGWVSLLSTSTISAVVAVIGIILRMFTSRQSNKHLGDILLGFSVLMFGMQAMSGAVSPLRQSPEFIRLLTSFSNPILGILVGAAVTSVLQSASAAVGILQALSMTGAVSFAVAYPIILGIAIGAAVPVLLTALGAKADGKRTSLAYLVAEVLGVIICGLAFYVSDIFVDYTFKHAILDTVGVAFVNTMFRAVTALVLMPFIPQIYKFTTRVIRQSDDELIANAEFDRLDERFLKHPPLAVEQSRLTVNSMARTAMSNLLSAIELLYNFDEKQAKEVEDKENLVDKFEDKIGTYLVRLNSSELDAKQNENVSLFLHALSDLERISDHAMNIAELAAERDAKKITFTPDAAREFDVLQAAVREVLDLAVNAFIEGDVEKAYRVEPLEEHIDVLCDQLKLHHIERLQEGRCSLNQGFVFNDILTNFERVADHCSNLAVALIEIEKGMYDTHEYIIDLKELRSHHFNEYYEYYNNRYKI